MFKRRIFFGIFVAAVVFILTQFGGYHGIANQIYRTFNIGSIAQYYWEYQYNWEVPWITLLLILLIIIVSVTLLLTILKVKFLQSLAFAILVVFYFRDFTEQIINDYNLQPVINSTLNSIALEANIANKNLLLLVILTIIFFILLSFFNVNKKIEKSPKKVEKTEDKKEEEKSKLDKSFSKTDQRDDYSFDKNNKIRGAKEDANLVISQTINRCSDEEIKENLHTLRSQLNTIVYDYSQRKISFDEANGQINEILLDVEALSKNIDSINNSKESQESEESEEEVNWQDYEQEEIEKNYYEILGVSKSASKSEIKIAYMEKMKEYHPDKFSGKPHQEKSEARKKCMKINEAYHNLINIKK